MSTSAVPETSPVPDLDDLSLQDERREPVHSHGTELHLAASTALTSSSTSALTPITDGETHAQTALGRRMESAQTVDSPVRAPRPGRVSTASASRHTPLATTMPELAVIWASLYRDPELHRYEHPGDRYAPENPDTPEWLRSAWNPVNGYSTFLNATDAAASNIPEYDVHRERRNTERTITPQSFNNKHGGESISAVDFGASILGSSQTSTARTVDQALATLPVPRKASSLLNIATDEQARTPESSQMSASRALDRGPCTRLAPRDTSSIVNDAISEANTAAPGTRQSVPEYSVKFSDLVRVGIDYSNMPGVKQRHYTIHTAVLTRQSVSLAAMIDDSLDEGQNPIIRFETDALTLQIFLHWLYFSGTNARFFTPLRVSELLRLAALAENYKVELLQSHITRELHLRLSLVSSADTHTVFCKADIYYAFNDDCGRSAHVGELAKTLIVKWYMKYIDRMEGAIGPTDRLPYTFLAATSDAYRKNAAKGILPKDISFECEAVKFDPFANCPPCPAFGSSAAQAKAESSAADTSDSQTGSGTQVRDDIPLESEGIKIKLKSIPGGTAERVWHSVPKVGKFDHYVHMDDKFANKFQTLTARPQLSSWSIEELRLGWPKVESR